MFAQAGARAEKWKKKIKCVLSVTELLLETGQQKSHHAASDESANKQHDLTSKWHASLTTQTATPHGQGADETTAAGHGGISTTAHLPDNRWDSERGYEA